jgi:DNA-3-methyladenine glycosylase II
MVLNAFESTLEGQAPPVPLSFQIVDAPFEEPVLATKKVAERIRPMSPYDFELSAHIFSEGDHQIRAFDSGRFWQLLRTGDSLVHVSIASGGTAESPLLAVEMMSTEELGKEDKASIIGQVRAMLSLDLDIMPFYEQVSADPVLMKLAVSLRGLKPPKTPSVFEALIDSIIEQQISLNVAHTLQNRLVRKFGRSLEFDGMTFFKFPSPEELAHLTADDLRAIGISWRKAEYVRDVSKMIVEGSLDLESLEVKVETEGILDELTSIRGIGRWTAELVIIRGMGRFDVIPADDLGIRRIVSHFYFGDRKVDAEEVRSLAEGWGIWRGMASYYLIVAERLGIQTDRVHEKRVSASPRS